MNTTGVAATVGTKTTFRASCTPATTAVAPTVTSLSPTSGTTAGGTAVTLTGTGFTGASAVRFGATAAASFTFVSDTQITAVSPAGAAGAVSVTVTTSGGTSTTGAGSQFTYVAPAVAPTVTSLSPTTGTTAGGTAVTLTGTGFTGASAVRFGGTAAASFSVVSDTQITATSPAGASGAVSVTVTTSGGTSTTGAGSQFTYVAPAVAPTVTSLSPTTGTTAGGTAVTLTGTGFTGASAVRFGGTAAASFSVVSDTQITATSPAGAAGAVIVTVTTSGGTSATGAGNQFTYVAPAVAPTVTSLSPTTGTTAGGTAVTLTGTGFTGASAVRFGGTAAASFSVVSDTQITATSPAGAAGAVIVTVTTSGGTSATGAGNQFTYVAPTPAPTAASRTVAVPFNTPTAIDLSGSISGAHTSIVVASGPTHGSTNVSGDTVTYTPTTGYSGPDSFTYVARGLGGDSAPATVSIIVGGRPDPSADPNVRAISDAQAEAARQMGRTQLDNVIRRTEQLHGVRETDRSDFGTRLAFAALTRQGGQDHPFRDAEDLLADGRWDGLDKSGWEKVLGTGRSYDSVRAEQRRLDRTGGPQWGPVSFWTGGSIQLGTYDPTVQRSKFNVAGVGVSGGADIRLTDRLAVGLGVGFGETESKFNGAKAHLQADTKAVLAYFSLTPIDGSFIDGTLGYGAVDFRTRRQVSELSAIAQGRRTGALMLGALSMGLDQRDGPLRWSLYGRGIYEGATLDAYAETGAGFGNLRFDQRQLMTVSGVLGGRLGFVQETSIGTLTPWVRGEWMHALQGGGDQRLDYADMAGASRYAMRTEAWARDRFGLSLGSELELPSDWTVSLEIGAQISASSRSAAANFGFVKKF